MSCCHYYANNSQGLLGPGSHKVSSYRVSLTVVLHSINQGKAFNSENSGKALSKKIFL